MHLYSTATLALCRDLLNTHSSLAPQCSSEMKERAHARESYDMCGKGMLFLAKPYFAKSESGGLFRNLLNWQSGQAIKSVVT